MSYEFQTMAETIRLHCLLQMLVLLLHLLIERQIMVMVVVMFVMGLGVAVVESGKGSHNFEREDVMQVVHDVGVLVVALPVVCEDIALVVADVEGVS